MVLRCWEMDVGGVKMLGDGCWWCYDVGRWMLVVLRCWEMDVGGVKMLGDGCWWC